MMLDTEDESDRKTPVRTKRRPKRMLEKVDEETEDCTDSDMDCFVFSDGGEDEGSDTDYSTFSEDDSPDQLSDDSSVSDHEYDAGPDESGVIVWRHIAFYIVRSLLPWRPNILLAKVTLLHTKDEDNKPPV